LISHFFKQNDYKEAIKELAKDCRSEVACEVYTHFGQVREEAYHVTDVAFDSLGTLTVLRQVAGKVLDGL